MNLTGFAVEEFRSANNFAAERGTDCLMAEANTENWKFSGESLD